jgi:tetratricopeptide (TPR) repeat protein
MTRKSTKGILYFSRLYNFFMCAGIILGICAILAACSPSQVELDAPDTELAIDTSATQTTVPRITDTPTVTPVDPSQYTPNPEAVTLVEEAFAYSRQGDDEKAIETYTLAIEIDPLFALAYTNRGAVYADNGELGKS